MDRRRALVAAGYDALGDGYLDWASGVIDARERLLEELTAPLAPGSRILDLGCGAGLPSTKALAAAFTVTGVDISAGQVSAARRNVPRATFVLADMADVDFPAGSFDAVTALYALTHLPREEHAGLFVRIARWLVPGGRLLAVLSASDGPDWTGDWLGRPMYFSSPGAAVSRRLLVRAGFELLHDEIVATQEPEGPVEFLWVIARTGAGAQG